MLSGVFVVALEEPRFLQKWWSWWVTQRERSLVTSAHEHCAGVCAAGIQ